MDERWIITVMAVVAMHRLVMDAQGMGPDEVDDSIIHDLSRMSF